MGETGRHTAPMKLALVIGGVALLLLPACGAAQRQSDLYTAVPESAWPQMDGVSVIRSRGSDGNSCCEPSVGSRNLVVQMSSHQESPLLALQQSLSRAGWAPTRCPTGATVQEAVRKKYRPIRGTDHFPLVIAARQGAFPRLLRTITVIANRHRSEVAHCVGEHRHRLRLHTGHDRRVGVKCDPHFACPSRSLTTFTGKALSPNELDEAG